MMRAERLFPLVTTIIGLTLVFTPTAAATTAGGDGRIAFMRNTIGSPTFESSVYTIRPNGSGLVRLTSGDNDAEPVWSPDGHRIAFVRSGDIWVMGAWGGHLHQVTTAAGTESEPAWSPNGTHIAFVSNRTGVPNIFELRSSRPYGHAVQLSFDTAPLEPCGATSPAFAPDDSVYWLSNTCGNATIMHTPVDHAAATSVHTCYTCYGIDVSPSGDTLLYTVTPGGTELDCTGIEQYQVTTDTTTELFTPCINGQGTKYAAWSPSGTRLVFQQYTQAWQGIASSNTNGTGVTRLIANAYSPSWQPTH